MYEFVVTSFPFTVPTQTITFCFDLPFLSIEYKLYCIAKYRYNSVLSYTWEWLLALVPLVYPYRTQASKQTAELFPAFARYQSCYCSAYLKVLLYMAVLISIHLVTGISFLHNLSTLAGTRHSKLWYLCSSLHFYDYWTRGPHSK